MTIDSTCQIVVMHPYYNGGSVKRIMGIMGETLIGRHDWDATPRQLAISLFALK